ncbi:MAG TPA: uroporphyrinogen-III C-methyltransferase [Chitinophagaceae bacterium]|nr:uroporphyrinogen-III C-methyltransferase [Chitinophagaceae bacterium]
MEEKKNTGKVVLAGAGPGDPELITVKLQKRLAGADVIITDRLANPSIISQHAHKDAEIIFAGKQGYNEASLSQEEITAMIIRYALSGKTVLRLKGGDVAFFSNVADELKALQQHDLPVEIIPGITAASGASAYAGIPLTARGYAQAVQFIAFNPNNDLKDEQWQALAATRDTLVFYMASKNLLPLVAQLLIHSKDPLTPLAVIEQATTPHQKVYTTVLEQCAADFAGLQFSSPSLVIVGKVVELHQQFAWYKANEDGTVFKELKG